MMSELKKKLIEIIEKTPDSVLARWIVENGPKTTSNPIDDFLKECGSAIFDKGQAISVDDLKLSFQQFSGTPISDMRMNSLLMDSESWGKYEFKKILINGNQYISGLRLRFQKGMRLINEEWDEMYVGFRSLVENPEMPIRVID